MPTTTEDDKVNCVLAQFKTAIAKEYCSTTAKCDTKWILEKMKDLNCKVLATRYLQSNHPKWIGNTFLHFAFGSNNINRLFELNKSSVNLVLSAHLENRNFENPSNNNGLSHLHIACAANNVEVVEGFLSNGVLVNHAVNTDSSLFPGFNPLHFAARFCAFEVLEVLLSHDADACLKNAEELTPLHIALEQRLEIMSKSYTSEALSEKNDKIVQLLLCKMAEINNLMFIDDLGLSQLHVACTLKDSKVAENLLNKVVNIDHTVKMDSSLWPSYTALHFASLCNIDTVKLLMKKGADISIKDTKGITPFDICVEKYKVEDFCEVIFLDPIWKNVMLSDGRTKLTDLMLAMKHTNQISTFLGNLNDNLGIGNSPLWTDWTLMHLGVLFANQCFLKYLCQQNPRMLLAQDVHGCTPLHLAYRLNKKQVIYVLLKFLNEVCPNLIECIDHDGLSFIHIAAAKNDVQLLKQMLSIGSDVNAVYKGKSDFSPEVCSGSTPLHFAVVNGSVKTVKILVEHGADVYAKDANDMTPIHLLMFNTNASSLLMTPNLKNSVVGGTGLSHLHIASMCGEPKCMESLLNDGGDINGVITCAKEGSSRIPFLEKYVGCSPLHCAIARGIPELRAVEVLLKRGADILIKKTEQKAPLYSVLVDHCYSYDNVFLKVLLENHDLQSRLRAETGMTALHVACLYPSDFKTIEKLLDEGTNVNAQIRADSPIFKGYSPLHVVLQRLHFWKTTEALINKGADVTLTNAESRTPLHMAFEIFNEHNSEETYSYLNMMLEAQRNYGVNPVDVNGITHFHIACRMLNASVVQEFLKHDDIDIDRPIDFFHDKIEDTEVAGYTALHLMAAINAESDYILGYDVALRQLNIIDLLLKHGANVHVEDPRGETPLHKCARNIETFSSESLDLFERFARAGADVNARNIDGNTPLYYFLESDDITSERIKTLLRLGCRLNTFNTVTDIGYMGKTLNAIPKEEVEKFFSVLTINFAQELETDGIRRTVIHNLISEEGSRCTANKYATYIEQLSKIGCDVDDQDNFGRTALHMAAKFTNCEGLSALLILGADVNLSDNDGQTAFDNNFFYKVRFREFEGTYFHVLGKRPHPVILKTLAFHVKKLQLCGIEVNKQNEDLASKAFEKLENDESWSEKFFKELETTKGIKIGDQSLALFDFLSETGAVAGYPRMLLQQRKAVDKFFSSKGVKVLREKFPELAGILQLQYRKARARTQLIEPATNELKVLLEVELPEICTDHILALLKNSELISLISSTAI